MKKWTILACLLLACCAPAFGQRVIEVPLTTNHMVYDTVSGKIYATVPSSAGADGNSVAVIDPATGNVDQTVYVGSEPDPIAVSDDGQFLYVGLDGSSLVQRVRIATMTPDLSFALGNGQFGPYHAAALAVVPGGPHSVAVSLSYTGEDPNIAYVAIFDDGVQRPNTASGGGAGSLAFNSSGSTLYINAVPANVTPQGLTLDQSAYGLVGAPYSYDAVNNLLYGHGMVEDPTTDQLKGTFDGSFSPGYSEYDDAFEITSMATDPSHHAVYILYSPFLGTSDVIVGEYDADTYLPIGSTVLTNQLPNQTSSALASDLELISDNTLALRNPIGHVLILHHGALPGLSQLQLSSPIIASGQTITGTITLTTPAPKSGVSVLLTSNYGSALNLPASVLFPAGSMKEDFSIKVGTITSNQSTLVSAGYGIQTLSAPLDMAQSANSQEYPANVRVVYLPHNSLLADPLTGEVYATVPSTAGRNGNSLVQISPQTLSRATLGFIGSEPDRLALSDDGSYLYTSLDGSASVTRYDTSSGTVGLQFSLGNDPNDGPRFARDMVVLPGNSNALAVAYVTGYVSSPYGGVRVFVDGTQSAGVVNDFDSLAVNPSIPGRIYAYDNEGYNFGRLSYGASGLSLIDSQWDLLYGSYDRIAFDNGKVYSSGGRVIDPETYTVLGTFPDVNNPAFVLPDSTDGYVYFVTPTAGGGYTYTLNVYNPNTYSLQASYPLTNIYGSIDVFGSLDSLCRTGPDRIVFGTNAGQVVFVNATPAALVSNTLAAATIQPGSFTTATIAISNVAPIGGVPIALSCADHKVIVPATVTVPVGDKSVTYTVGAEPVNVENHAVIRATYNGVTRGASLTINP